MRSVNSRVALLAKAIRRGMIYMIPLLMIGSFSLFFLSLPIPGYRLFMTKIFGSRWDLFFHLIRNSTSDFFSVCLVVSVSFSFISLYNNTYGSQVNPFIGSMTSLCSFIAVSGFGTESFSFSDFGEIGVLAAIIVSITASLLFKWFSGITRFRSGSFGVAGDLTLGHTIEAIVPASLTLCVFAGIMQFFSIVFGIRNICDFASNQVCRLFFMIRSIPLAGSLYVLCVHLFWFIGIHGGDMLESVVERVFPPIIRSVASGSGDYSVFTKTFFTTFVLMGGSGATFSLLFAILIAGKDRSQRYIAKLSFIPAILNINELVIFGMPIVFNPVFFIPFVGVPLICTMTTALAMILGIVPHTIHVVEWTTPVLLSGLSATGSLRGSVLQIFNLIIGTACYIPFVRISDRVSKQKIETEIKQLYSVYREYEERGIPSALMHRYDECGIIARVLAAELKTAITLRQVSLFYQPQVDYTGKLFGTEALLRWRYHENEYVYPPLIIALAREAGFIDQLGHYIFDVVCSDMEHLASQGTANLITSINIIPEQLAKPDFVTRLIAITDAHHIPHHLIEIEITEQLALTDTALIDGQLKKMEEAGFRLAMDDFGMGHSSLMYLKKYKFDTVKLDGSLVKDLSSSETSKDIISSITTLGKQIGYDVIAEFVEKEDQKQQLHLLGCNQYQGYLYAQALSYEKLVTFCRSMTDTAN